MVRNKSTFIVGVMKTTKNFERQTGVPWLCQIPYMGGLFRNEEMVTEDQELLFLVRPEIVRN